MPGVEDIAWLEVRERLPGAQFQEKLFAKEKNGMVLFGYNGRPADLLQLRTAEDVFVTAYTADKVTRGWQDLYQLTDLIKQSPEVTTAVDTLMDFFRETGRGVETTFRVISRQYGRFEYRRKDLERSVSKGFRAKYPHWRLVPDNAHVEVWVNELGSRLLIGLRLSDHSMRHRFKKAVEMPASLRPSVAAAMVLLTEPQPDDVFLDPMCGSGTIVMERRLTNAYQQLLATDIEADRVAAAQANVRGQRRERPSDFTALRSDARRLPFATGSIDKVATNLPFGKQIGSVSALKRLYPAFFKELERVLCPGGRAIVLSSEYELVKTAVRGCPQLNILTGYSIAILGTWGRIYIIRREA